MPPIFDSSRIDVLIHTSNADVSIKAIPLESSRCVALQIDRLTIFLSELELIDMLEAALADARDAIAGFGPE